MTLAIEATKDVVTYMGAAGYSRAVKVRAVEWDSVPYDLKKWLWDRGPEWQLPTTAVVHQAAVFTPEETEADWHFERGYIELTAVEAVIEAAPWHWLDDDLIESASPLFEQAQAERERRLEEKAAARRQEEEARAAAAKAEHERWREAGQRVADGRAQVIASPGTTQIKGKDGAWYNEDGRVILWRKGRKETGFTLHHEYYSGWQITHAATGLAIGPTWPTLDEAAGVAAVIAGMYDGWEQARTGADVPAAVVQEMAALFEVLQ